MNNNLSNNLKKIRKERNLSQEQLADELGVSRQAISKWESATAYPEMDKIIALCDKFGVNIDDLLHGDIKEIKGEEESKLKINKAVDDFLKFVTDTVNLFSNMTFKSKVKCLFEQVMIALVLFLASIVIIGIGNFLQDHLLFYIPGIFGNFLQKIVETILTLFCIIASIAILIYVFKSRYLDYYQKSKTEKEEKEDESKEVKHETKKEKIDIKQEENKIIIRDPKHSEYKFLNGLWKLIIGFIKLIVAGIGLSLCCTLIFLAIVLALTFKVFNTGAFFLGIFGSTLASIIITIIFLLIVLNFIFNRKNDKKKMIIAFIASLIILGLSFGLTFIGSLNFDIVEGQDDMLVTENKEFDMTENLFFYTSYGPINYVEEDRPNIKLEYKINQLFTVKTYQHEESSVYISSYCSSPIKVAREFVKELNHKKIVPINDEIYDLTIYASPENIAILKDNYEKDRERNTWEEDRIRELEEQIEELESKLAEQE